MTFQEALDLLQRGMSGGSGGPFLVRNCTANIKVLCRVERRDFFDDHIPLIFSHVDRIGLQATMFLPQKVEAYNLFGEWAETDAIRTKVEAMFNNFAYHFGSLRVRKVVYEGKFASIDDLYRWVNTHQAQMTAELVSRHSPVRSAFREATGYRGSRETMCHVCEDMFSSDDITTMRVAELDSLGKVREDENGNPLEVDLPICYSCEGNYDDEDQDEMHYFDAPNPKEKATFERWPFSRTCGVELEVLTVSKLPSDAIRALKWKMVHDGSIVDHRGTSSRARWPGIEFNSPPRCGDAFLDEMIESVSLWHDKVRVNKTCGFHVHVDWSDLDRLQKANCQNFLVAMEDLLFALQPPSRSASEYCRKWGKRAPLSTETAIFKSQKYMGVNFSHAEPPGLQHSSSGHEGGYGTIEFRMGAGTRSLEKIVRWSELCLRLVEIGADLLTEDSCKSIREMTVSGQLNLFEKLAREYDKRVERPSEYLTQLIGWIEGRLQKFGNKTKKESVSIPLKAKASFAKAKPVPLESDAERFEERLGIA
jgi:hypothetical protein